MYKEIVVITKSVASDAVADIMWELGANGVKVMDPKDLDFVLHSDTCWDYVDDNLLNLPDDVKVSFFVEEEEVLTKLEHLKSALVELENKYGKMDIAVEDVPDVDWGEDWKKFYKPIKVGNYNVIAEWLDDVNDGITIKINPSNAFGTGEHSSTRLCLTLMSNTDFKAKSVIDVGAGSGILGIAAAKSGAKSINMCDIDKETLKCAEENSLLNEVYDKVILTAGGIEAIPQFKADILLCNLTADILNKILVNLTRYIKENGIVICSGILDTRAEEIIDNFKTKSFKLIERVDEGEWVGLKFIYGA